MGVLNLISMADASAINVVPMIPGILVHPFWMTLDEILQVKVADQIYSEAGLSDQVNNWRSLFITTADHLLEPVSFDTCSGILSGLVKVLGPRGSKAILYRAGRRMYEKSIQYTGVFTGLSHEKFGSVPLDAKIGICLTAFVETLNSTAPNAAIAYLEDGTPRLSISICPICWKRDSELPSCHLVSGLLEEMLFHVTAIRYRVLETSCIAAGNPACVFSVIKK